MKCTYCDQALDPLHVWIVIAYTPDPHVVNLHTMCLRTVLGGKPHDNLARLVYHSGWHQVELPGMEADLGKQ